MIPVEGHRGLYRDDNSKAIINCNENEYNDYIRLKNKLTIDKEEVNNLKLQVEELRQLLNNILGN